MKRIIRILSGIRRSDESAFTDIVNNEELDDIEIKIPPVFILGTGRCGTHFLEAVMRSDKGVFSVDPDAVDPVADSFLRYALWYQIPFDTAPSYSYRRRLIAFAQQKRRAYFESNAYLSLAAKHLYDWYSARLILLVRRPQDVVNSHIVKGWYEKDIVRTDNTIPPGFPPGMKPNHFFGRIMPLGEEYERWMRLTRVGKISWWVNTLNMKVLELFADLPKSHVQTIKVEELDYAEYRKLHTFSGGKDILTRDEYQGIRNSRPGKGKKRKTSLEWSDKEWQEFLQETKDLHEYFNYEALR